MRTEHTNYPADPTAMRESADWTENYRRDMRRTVNDNPGGALLTAFGAGFGLGLAIGLSMVMGEDRRSPTRRRMDRAWHRADEFGDRFSDRAEELGHRVIDSLRDYLPDSMSRRM